MDELIDRIEQTVSELMQYDMEHFGPDAQEMVNHMMVLFPAIIECYKDPRMTDVKEDALYWPGQLERIIKSLEKGDYFEIVDVLY
nr:hypothetical protein [Lachnospiraceae bacterium]